MFSAHLPHLLTAPSGRELAFAVLWAGLITLSGTLAVMMWTRWGQSRLIQKCLGLSVLAHLWLCGYSATVPVSGSPLPGPAPQPIIRVSLADVPPPGRRFGPLPHLASAASQGIAYRGRRQALGRIRRRPRGMGRRASGQASARPGSVGQASRDPASKPGRSGSSARCGAAGTRAQCQASPGNGTGPGDVGRAERTAPRRPGLSSPSMRQRPSARKTTCRRWFHSAPSRRGRRSPPPVPPSFRGPRSHAVNCPKA